MTARKTQTSENVGGNGARISRIVLGHGFYRDLSANNEETYKGLKLFSDVIDWFRKTMWMRWIPRK